MNLNWILNSQIIIRDYPILADFDHPIKEEKKIRQSPAFIIKYNRFYADLFIIYFVRTTESLNATHSPPSCRIIYQNAGTEPRR